jgi:hypothetical protein
MNKYLITYDLKNKSIKSYEPLYAAIKSIGPWWHHLDSTWIVKTNLTSSQIWNILGSHLLTNDHILVIKIDVSDKWGWLPQDAWIWLNT